MFSYKHAIDTFGDSARPSRQTSKTQDDEVGPPSLPPGSPAARPAAEPESGEAMIAIIDRRALGRETLTQALEVAGGRFSSRAFADVGEWLVDDSWCDTSVVLLGIAGASSDDPELVEDLRHIARDHPDVAVIVMGDREDLPHVLAMLSHGARGYIPTSVSLSVAIGALSLVVAGGQFVPATAFLSPGRLDRAAPTDPGTVFRLTERQAAIAEGISRGKPNKIIAHELNLCESTVKVHIRSIMRKLQARNRTEVAFKLHAAQPRSNTQTGY